MVTLPEGLQVGDVVAGKYEILRVIGAGAMGVVVAAHHLNLDRKVALKFLVTEALAHPDALTRFALEARATAKIANPHVVAVNDVAFLPSGTPYIELEYLEGSDLAERLRAGGPLPVEVAVDFVLQACDGLAEAHGLGIVHRDLKPANLFVVRGPGGAEIIKVLDFGVSKARQAMSSTLPPGAGRAEGLSTSGGPIGSPCYMSPEQMQSAPDVDARSDVWSLGVTLCELVTGELPFRGQSLVEIFFEVKSQQPLCLRSRQPDLPAGLEAVIARCLQFDRRLRFAGVSELARALAPFAANRPASDGSAAGGSRIPTISSAEPMLHTQISAAPEPVIVNAPAARRATHSPRVVLAGAAAGAAVLTLGVWIGDGRRSRALRPPPASTTAAPARPVEKTVPGPSERAPSASATAQPASFGSVRAAPERGAPAAPKASTSHVAPEPPIARVPATAPAPRPIDRAAPPSSTSGDVRAMRAPDAGSPAVPVPAAPPTAADSNRAIAPPASPEPSLDLQRRE